MIRDLSVRESQIFLGRVDIPFDDIDAGGVLYNAHYLKYCDRARNSVFAKFDWTWDRMVASRCILAVVSVEAEYRRAVRQGPVWIATHFSMESDRFLNASHSFLRGELSEAEARSAVNAWNGPLEKMRGVYFRAKFRLVPIAMGNFVPASLDPEFADAIFK